MHLSNIILIIWNFAPVSANAFWRQDGSPIYSTRKIKVKLGINQFLLEFFQQVQDSDFQSIYYANFTMRRTLKYKQDTQKTTTSSFQFRHIGPNEEEQKKCLLKLALPI